MAAQSLSTSDLTSLHQRSIQRVDELVSLFETAMAADVTLESGVDRKSRIRTAVVSAVNRGRLSLEVTNLDPVIGSQLFFNFVCAGRDYFFALDVDRIDGRAVEGRLPLAVFERERREGRRNAVSARERVFLTRGSSTFAADVRDRGKDGISVCLPQGLELDYGDEFDVASGDHAPVRLGVVKHITRFGGRRFAGMSLTSVRGRSAVDVQRLERIAPGSRANRVVRQAALAGSALASRSLGALGVSRTAHSVEVVEFHNPAGQPIKGIVDRTSLGPCDSVVVIPRGLGPHKGDAPAVGFDACRIGAPLRAGAGGAPVRRHEPPRRVVH